MQLPGGLWHNDERCRRFDFKPLTGNVELALAEIAGSDDSLPSKVTAALSAALCRVGGNVPTPSRVEVLCVADRQFLMRCLAVFLGMEEIWLTVRCARCGKCFDFFIKQSELPVKEAGEGFPFASVETSAGLCRIRIPNGADQVAIAAIEDFEVALQTLVYRCIMGFPDASDGEGKPENLAKKFSADDFRRVEVALEEVAAEVTTMVQATCPECKQANFVEVDPYMCLQQGQTNLFSEIHILASTYHWSETDILSMHKSRRQRYLKLIDRSRGMVQ
jgi:phage FluMu protein Com